MSNPKIDLDFLQAYVMKHDDWSKVEKEKTIEMFQNVSFSIYLVYKNTILSQNFSYCNDFLYSYIVPIFCFLLFF